MPTIRLQYVRRIWPCKAARLALIPGTLECIGERRIALHEWPHYTCIGMSPILPNGSELGTIESIEREHARPLISSVLNLLYIYRHYS